MSSAFKLNQIKMERKIDYLSFFAVKGNLCDELGVADSQFFELTEPKSGRVVFLFRVNQGTAQDETRQYVGFYTGLLPYNISFLPGCDMIRIGSCKVNAACDVNSISRVVHEVAAMGSAFQIAGLVLSNKDVDSSVHSVEKAAAISIIKAVSIHAAIEDATLADTVNVVDEWTFFAKDDGSAGSCEYPLALAVTPNALEQVAKTLRANDRRLSELSILKVMLGNIRIMNAGLAIVMYHSGNSSVGSSVSASTTDIGFGSMDEIVGCAALHPIVKRASEYNEMSESGRRSLSRTNLLVSIYMCEELRRKGHGRRLLRKAKDVCRGTLLAYVPDDDEVDTYNALAFFGKCDCKMTLVRSDKLFPVETDTPEFSHRVLVL